MIVGGLAGLIYLEDSRMLEKGRGLGLTGETGNILWRLAMRRDELEKDRTRLLLIVGAIQ
jgi:hypothetical protein